MLLIYTFKITPRLSFVMKQIFVKILGIEIGFTTKVEDFIKHSGPKITYTKKPLQNEFFVRSNDLLFEQGIQDPETNVTLWGDVPCFFPTGERSNIPYDIFAASFYLLSRYEEYLPHVKDIHGRFSPKDSLGYQNKFLELPVVDLWAYKLQDLLIAKFPELIPKNGEYKYVSLLDITISHAYSNRNLLRGVAGFILDLSRLQFKRILERILVLLKIKKDPYDNFSLFVDWHRKYEIESIFFFQFAEYSKYDKNVSTHDQSFRSLIKHIADYSKIALGASYSSFMDIALLNRERKGLEAVINRPVTTARMRYNRVDVPDTYRNLVATEFTADYTMGYTHEIGFRAGTCTPFQFYDIPLEVEQSVKVYSFAVHDYALKKSTDLEKVHAKLKAIKEVVKGVNGTYITVFSNELLGGEEQLDWKKIYKYILSTSHV